MRFRGRDPYKFFGVTPTEVTLESGKKALCFTDRFGSEILTKQEFEEMMSSAKEFYDQDGIEDAIHHENRLSNFIGHSFMDTEIVEDKRILPSPVYKYKEFRSNLEKDWSFKCGWCNTKVSSKDSKGYYLINAMFTPDIRHISARLCSEACAINYWNDDIVNVIKDQGFDDIYHLDKSVGR